MRSYSTVRVRHYRSGFVDDHIPRLVVRMWPHEVEKQRNTSNRCRAGSGRAAGPPRSTGPTGRTYRLKGTVEPRGREWRLRLGPHSSTMAATAATSPAPGRSGGPAYGDVVGVATGGPVLGSPSARERSVAVAPGLLTVFTPLEMNMQPKKGAVTRSIGPVR